MRRFKGVLIGFIAISLVGNSFAATYKYDEFNR